MARARAGVISAFSAPRQRGSGHRWLYGFQPIPGCRPAELGIDPIDAPIALAISRSSCTRKSVRPCSTISGSAPIKVTPPGPGGAVVGAKELQHLLFGERIAPAPHHREQRRVCAQTLERAVKLLDDLALDGGKLLYLHDGLSHPALLHAARSGS